MWSPEKTNELIEFFREKTVLWDPTDMDFKDRNKKHDAWDELAVACSVSRDEVEAKTRKLIGQFQRELKKGKIGDGADAPYKTRWSYFLSLSFLKDKYENRHQREAAMDSLHADQHSEDTSQSSNHEQQNTECFEDASLTPVFEPSVPKLPPVVPKLVPNSGKAPEAIRAKNKEGAMAEGAYYADMRPIQANSSKKDDLDVFGDFTARSLRNLQNQSSVTEAKFQISSILYNVEKNDQLMSSSAAASIQSLGSRDSSTHLHDSVRLNNEAQVIKNKWKGLRDVFRRELKKAQPDDSGDPLYTPKWPYYDSMYFLKDSMFKRETNRGGSADGDESHCDPLIDTEALSVPSLHTHHSIFEPPPTKKVKTEDDLSNDQEPRFEMEEGTPKHFTDYMQDSETLFLMSLLPFLKNIPPSRQLAVRTNLLQVFANEQTAQQYHS